MKKYFAFVVVTLVAQALGGCSSCSKEEEIPVESTPIPMESATTGGSLLSAPKMKAPALKGIMQHPDGGMMSK